MTDNNFMEDGLKICKLSSNAERITLPASKVHKMIYNWELEELERVWKERELNASTP